MRLAPGYIVHGDPENGIIMQYRVHDDADCPRCVKETKEREKSDPMLRKMPLVGFRRAVTLVLIFCYAIPGSVWKSAIMGKWSLSDLPKMIDSSANNSL